MPPSSTDQDHATRTELQRIATHVLARAQHAETGRIGLRVSPGGFSTVPFGDDQTRLRVSGTTLIRESSASKTTAALSIVGSSLAGLAEFAGVDLTTQFSAGTDTPPIGEPDALLAIEVETARGIAAWFDLAAQAIDVAVASAPDWSAPSIAQLWPEHFDVAIDLAFDRSAPDERRVNLGGGPGDGYHAAPYLYVGPWTADRPGDPEFWNASFGAVLSIEQVAASADQHASASEFFRSGLDRLTR